MTPTKRRRARIRHMRSIWRSRWTWTRLRGLPPSASFTLCACSTKSQARRRIIFCLPARAAGEGIAAEVRAAITDVCLEVGYNSLGTFSKTFSELVGFSPQEFRAHAETAHGETICHGHLALSGGAAKRSPGRSLKASSRAAPAERISFVGAFTSGVPLGVPFSGTVMVGRGKFRIERPAAAEFHLLAAFVPLSANLAEMVVNIPISLVASLRVQNENARAQEKPRLRLRPLRRPTRR